MSTTVYRLVADDDEAWYDLGHYRSAEDAEADRAIIESRYPGRPYWIDFRVDAIDVSAGQRTETELADALIAFADRSEIDSRWHDENAPESYLSEHGKRRP